MASRLPRPLSVFPWDVKAVDLIDASSAVVATRLLDSEPRPSALYEIHSVRCTMSIAGTGNLASAGITNGPELPAGVGNTDGALMSIRSNNRIGGADSPSLIWHWGRAETGRGSTGDGTIYLPPEFYWDGEMYGILQNGAGATVDALFTVVFRIVEFSKRDFLRVVHRVLPGTIEKLAKFIA